MDVKIVEIGNENEDPANVKGLEMAVVVAKQAFQGDPDIETIIRDSYADPTAQPILSLLAFHSTDDNGPSTGRCCIGQVLFSALRLDPNPPGWTAAILGPLAVLPAHQKKSVGTKLVRFAMNRMKDRGVDLIFVLGSPKYYPRFGFRPAIPLGLHPPFALKESDAWMVMSTNTEIDISTVIGESTIKVICADSLNKQQYWTEP